MRDDLIAALLAAPKSRLLLTGGTQNLPEAAAAKAIVQAAPDAAFFAHFAPDALLWSGAPPQPRLAEQLVQAEIPAALFNLSAAHLGVRRQRRTLAGQLAGFSAVYCADEAAHDQLQSLGGLVPELHLTGPLHPMVALPPEDTQTRKTLSQRLAGRPVWAALGVTAENLPILAAAQVHARRAAPGLIVLVVPANGVDAPGLKAQFPALDIQSAVMDASAIEPGALVLASGQAALAARLAPVAVLADSLVAAGAQDSPLIPANLGAALIHGPHFGGFGDDFARLRAARASHSLGDNAALGAALVGLLRPDAAAQLATAAWAMLSETADTLGALAALCKAGEG